MCHAQQVSPHILCKDTCMQSMHIQQKPNLVSLQACLVAIFEVKSSSPDFFRLPDLSQPSVHHDPVPFYSGKV